MNLIDCVKLVVANGINLTSNSWELQQTCQEPVEQAAVNDVDLKALRNWSTSHTFNHVLHVKRAVLLLCPCVVGGEANDSSYLTDRFGRYIVPTSEDSRS